jgi:TolA-binding protein
VNQDPLDKLARALAAEHDGAHVAPDVARARIMQQLRSERRKKRVRLFCFAPLLSVGVGGAAFAAAGTDLPAGLAWVPALFASGQISHDVPKKTLAPSPSDRPPTEIAAPATGSIASAGPAPTEPVTTEPPPVPRLLAAPSAAPRGASAPAPKVNEASAPEQPALASRAQTDMGLAAYRQAHDAQFKAADFRTALAGYRRYLTEHPSGVLAAEANYNSALCQLRLGQTEAARRSLMPFAQGTYGSYRQEEARALLEALGAP